METMRVRCPCCGEIFELEQSHILREPAAVPRPMPDRLINVQLVFDGGSRGNPNGEGYGSFQVSIDGTRQPVRRLRFGEGYTNNMAEYDTLIAALQEVSRLGDRHRVILDIRGDSELLVKQVNGKYKVRDAKLKPRHARVLALLQPFGSWAISWHARDQSVEVLGH